MLTMSDDLYVECSRNIFTNCSAMICSSPGCSMNELMANPGRPSPRQSQWDGFELRRICEACCGVKAIFWFPHDLNMRNVVRNVWCEKCGAYPWDFCKLVLKLYPNVAAILWPARHGLR